MFCIMLIFCELSQDPSILSFQDCFCNKTLTFKVYLFIWETARELPYSGSLIKCLQQLCWAYLAREWQRAQLLKPSLLPCKGLHWQRSGARSERKVVKPQYSNVGHTYTPSFWFHFPISFLRCLVNVFIWMFNWIGESLSLLFISLWTLSVNLLISCCGLWVDYDTFQCDFTFPAT